ncbi:DNA repair protein RecO [Flavobacterium sp.]|uniref:DNA repair protein RecO n=1 Tax=Flavobacterium sp. TaxID=239 RepID=UPI0026359701|nr:DNA repair protein RecO [Flavobacterium sp.]MDD2984836.1 DNA repair protein RecO [Flavobacterium sp.]
MQVKTKAIVISALKYQEKSLIVKCLTLSDGMKTYFVANAFASKKNLQKIAYFQPLTILEIEAKHKNKGTLEYFKEVRMGYPFKTIHQNIVKSAIVLFLSEVLHHCIQEEEKNEDFFNYLEAALFWLDEHDEAANFHLILLLGMTRFFGFYPAISNQNAAFFELTEGIFTPYHGVSCLSEHETLLFKKLINLRFDSEAKLFVAAERQLLLKIVLDYYAIHLDGFKKPKSLDVLAAVFS